MSELKLPAWARVIDGNPKLAVTIEVDTDAAYNAWLRELGVLTSDGADLLGLDQYWIETAYQCIKMDVQAALELSPLSPVLMGRAAQINFVRAPQWELKKYKVGRGTLAATKGREARAHYSRVRGRVPFSG